MGVPFYNFHDLHTEEFRTAIKEKISKIIDTNAFVEGEYNTKFEQDFAKMQTSKRCLLVANGTDALEISLIAYDIKPGDKVGVPGITFYATAEAVLNVGAIPVFIDVDAEAGLMCPKSLASVAQKHELKAIIPVHIYGLPAPIAELEKVCTPKNIKIIEDAAQAHGTILPTGPVGSTNNLTTFSFYPTKNLSAFGDAGGILINDESLIDKINAIRNHGRGQVEERLGRNSRCDHMQAAVLSQKLENVEQYNKQRKDVAKMYHEALKGLDVRILPAAFLETSSWHLYPIHMKTTEERIELQAKLKENEIGCTPFYDQALSEMGPLSKYEGEDEVSKSFAGKTICLPMNPFMSQEDVNEVSKVVADFLK